MSQEERELLIEWLAMTGDYKKSLYSKMEDGELEFYFLEMLGDKSK